jgi:hypothetical protein
MAINMEASKIRAEKILAEQILGTIELLLWWAAGSVAEE